MVSFSSSRLALASILLLVLRTSEAKSTSDLRGKTSKDQRNLFWYSSNVNMEAEGGNPDLPWDQKPAPEEVPVVEPETLLSRQNNEDELPDEVDGAPMEESEDSVAALPEESADEPMTFAQDSDSNDEDMNIAQESMDEPFLDTVEESEDEPIPESRTKLSENPSMAPSGTPTTSPSSIPSDMPSKVPSISPTRSPSVAPSVGILQRDELSDVLVIETDGEDETPAPNSVLQSENESSNNWKYWAIGGAVAVAVGAAVYLLSINASQQAAAQALDNADATNLMSADDMAFSPQAAGIHQATTV
ncbi:expressed unknown protein [Seminavis robusta]|uniref:Uncharacterized protein n=1 Tax=Seminavis robusta TaxID=568900 RepID=A0A9N8DRP9_9STRA|nr:expressed unknown protein [Seminavis robusta]|eukprot:Sro206_g086430.1 n/a (303) ;mRNA; f:9282-10586